MNDVHVFHKFPDGASNRDYEVFEEFPDGSIVWRACVFGMQNVESEFRELSRRSTNRLFALNLEDSDNPIYAKLEKQILPQRNQADRM